MRAVRVLAEIAAAADPEAQVESYRRPWNSGGAKDRIRLDNRPEDRSDEPGA